MTEELATRIVLVARPKGKPVNTDFRLEKLPLPHGKIKYREDIVDGIENAPQAFIELLEGRNFGKLIVKVS